MAEYIKAEKSKLVFTVLAVLGTFLLMAFLVRQMVKITEPAPVGADRAALRAKDNAEIRAGGIDQAKNWGYVDQPRGIVRLPLEDAMKLTLQGYQNAAEFKKDLAARSDKASTAPPPPKNEYE